MCESSYDDTTNRVGDIGAVASSKCLAHPHGKLVLDISLARTHDPKPDAGMDSFESSRRRVTRDRGDGLRAAYANGDAFAPREHQSATGDVEGREPFHGGMNHDLVERLRVPFIPHTPIPHADRARRAPTQDADASLTPSVPREDKHGGLHHLQRGTNNSLP